MATRLTGAALTVTITESLTIDHGLGETNDRSHSQTITKTFASIDNLEKRILNLPNTNQVQIAELGGTAAADLGTYKRSSVAYIRITNLDDTNGVAVILEDNGADTAALLVDADASLILTDTQIEAFTDGSAWSAWSDIDKIFLKAANANTQVEIVIATTE